MDYYDVHFQLYSLFFKPNKTGSLFWLLLLELCLLLYSCAFLIFSFCGFAVLNSLYTESFSMNFYMLYFVITFKSVRLTPYFPQNGKTLCAIQSSETRIKCLFIQCLFIVFDTHWKIKLETNKTAMIIVKHRTTTDVF